jgi:carbonic anhydrase
VDAVARTNVVLGIAEIRRRSPILEELGKTGSIQIVGAMYDLATGMVEFCRLIKSATFTSTGDEFGVQQPVTFLL